MTDTPPVLYCANHPNVETSLRCNNCEKPICPKCAVLTPTGYRCRECVRGQQKVFDNATWYDYPVVFVVVSTLSFLGSLLASVLGFFIIFIAAAVGVGIAEATRFLIQRRRSRLLFQVAAFAAAFGSLPLLVIGLIGFFLAPSALGNLWGLLWQGFYTLTVTSTVFYRLRGIQIR